MDNTSETSHAGDGMGAVLVKQSHFDQPMMAPRMTIDLAVCYRALPGYEAQCVVEQRYIQQLRDTGQLALAEQVEKDMFRKYMFENWRDTAINTVTTQGKNDLLDKYFAGSAYTAAWYVIPISSVSYSAISVADTAASHAGWTEAGATNAPNYTSGTRVALTFGAASGGVKATSSASSLTFNATGTTKGAGAISNSTKDGTTGVLYNAALFSGGDRAVVNTDVVNISASFTIA